MADNSLIRIPPFHYIHVLDSNTNVTHVIEGPLTYVRREHEQILEGPLKMIKIPPRSYCIIQNPVVKKSDGSLAIDSFDMVKVRFGDKEVRTSDTHPEPFPLYPWEALLGKIEKIPVVQQNHAFKLKAVRDFVDETGKKRNAGDEWLFIGPASYIPKIECSVVEEVKPFVINPNKALKIRAKRATKDCYGNDRKAGEEWLIRESGAYLPLVDEEIVAEVKAIVLTEKNAIHLRAVQNFTDVYKKPRKAGEEWLVTLKETDTHIPDVHEEVVCTVNAIVLNNRQFCYILDPYDPSANKNIYGKKILKKGECTFFLQPNESLEKGIQDVYVLSEEEALLLKSNEDFTDDQGSFHVAGDKWMIYGPCDYIPPIEVQVLERRSSIPLDENEGIYVRDRQTGEVKSVTGQSYMLKPHEELWEMELSPEVEELITRQITGETFQVAKTQAKGQISGYSSLSSGEYKRNKTRVVTFRVPHNSAVQVYDYKLKKSRVVFGPDRIMLGPDEQFTVLTLSGGTPKREGMIRNLACMLGPDFMTDVIVVETSDHASLSLKLTYNWYFDINREDEEDCNKVFKVRDFVGDACKTIASRIRGAVSAYSFEHFHQHCADIIKAAVFGRKGDEIKSSLRFSANNLVISNVDIQSVEPTDDRTKDLLRKSVTMAIQITTDANKARAEHEAKKEEQQARGQLKLLKIIESIDVEREQIRLAQLKCMTREVEITKKAETEALSLAKAAKIKLESLVSQTELEVKAKNIERDTEISNIREQNEIDIKHKRALSELEVKKARELAQIETSKFKQIMDAIGRDTIVSMARAGPELQGRLLKGLGLKGFMVMNSKNPINLFSTANGFLKSEES